jgi:branched-chain amino acid aminotransferase
MFATDDYIGVKPSEKYCFSIFTCPVGPYYAKPLRIKVEEKYSRAAPGGVGFTKCAGNYGAAMYPTKLAQSEGYDQVLWTDPVTHTLVEETGTTNFFAVTNNGVITPNLHETMLAGITRDSVIKILQKLGVAVEERPITVSELKNLHAQGNLKELFISGTAATLINIEGFAHQGTYFDVMKSGNTEISELLKNTLDQIRHGLADDTYGWVEKL